MPFKTVGALSLLLWASPVLASTVVIDSTHSATYYAWGTPGTGDLDGATYLIGDFGAASVLSDDPLRLAAGASFRLAFGSIFGGSDLGIAYLHNASAENVDNLGWYFSSAPGMTDFLSIAEIPAGYFVTVSYVDDIFGIGDLTIANKRFRSATSAVLCRAGEECPAVVPLPPALMLFLSALAVIPLKGIAYAVGKRIR